MKKSNFIAFCLIPVIVACQKEIDSSNLISQKSKVENKIKRKLYSDVNFIIRSAWNDTNNKWNFNVTPANSLFRNYTHYELDFTGLLEEGVPGKEKND